MKPPTIRTPTLSIHVEAVHTALRMERRNSKLRGVLGVTAYFALLAAAAPMHAGNGAPTCAELAWIPTFGGMPGVSDTVRALTVFDDGLGGGPALYAAGEFISAGGVMASRIARWNAASETWTPLGSGMDDTVFALTVFDDGLGGGPALYAGGGFTTAGGVTVNRIARWNAATRTWSPLGSGISGGATPSVSVLKVFDDGLGGGPTLYAGGSFTTAGGVSANRIARWNAASETWTPLGSGMNNMVLALEVFDDGLGGGPALYAGGGFTTAGGVTANRIARWNSATGTWSALGSGMSGVPTSTFVSALAVYDNGLSGTTALYAGGDFTAAGGVAANRIAKWNAVAGTWSPLGGGITGGSPTSVATLTVFDDGAGDGPALYVGGFFSISVGGGAFAYYLARWNGAEGWTTMAGGMNNWVYALTTFDDGAGDGPALYAGGFFSTAGGLTANRIARRNSATGTWSALGSGVYPDVFALTVFDDGLGGGPALYAAGALTTASGVPSLNRIARWNAAAGTWSPLGSGMSDWVYSLTVFDDGLGGGSALYAGGIFASAGGMTVNRIARWNAATGTWSPLGSGVTAIGTPAVLALTGFDDGSGGGPALYAGGNFATAGGVTMNRIARWNAATGTWSALGSGMSSTVRALTVFDDGLGGGPALYAGGQFTTSDGIETNRIARWNVATGSWSALGTGMDNTVRALTVFDDGLGGGPALYAGGEFTTADGVTVNGIARWNAASGTWSALGGGMNNAVRAIVVFDDGSGAGPALYAGGFFSTAGGVPVNGVARWNPVSETWSPLGIGMGGESPTVYAFAVFDDGLGDGSALYVGGPFNASPAGDSHIARWGCVEWSAPCAVADLNCDGAVDGSDLAMVLGGWGPCGSPPCVADINDDGVIDGNDLAIVLGAWGG